MEILNPIAISFPERVEALVGPVDWFQAFADLRDGWSPPSTLLEVESLTREMLDHDLDLLPLPGAGATFERWRGLAAVAGFDLSLAKIFESHTDALAILAELGETAARGKILAVWAAESPRDPLVFDAKNHRLNGTKSWCSGAAIVDEGLVTVSGATGEKMLVRVAMEQPGISVRPSRWANAGMAAAGTAQIGFSNVEARPVGKPGAYLSRPGFWQGGAGIAAVWLGGAEAIAETLRESTARTKDPHRAAHLGAVHSQLAGAGALLAQTAHWIDAHPDADVMERALTLRAVVEFAASETIHRTGRALGAGPLCEDAGHARRVADLEIFLRQSHAERDLAALGEAITLMGPVQRW